MVKIEVLGIAQDGGVPHLGCRCNNCTTLNHKVASLLIHGDQNILIDATPDITSQVRDIKIDAVLITHLHIGHYIGLLQFGREVMNTQLLPVYTTKSVASFLRKNKPFSYLIERNNIELKTLILGKKQRICGVEIIPFLVPHRNEDGDTIGLIFQDQKSLIYIPDIDYLTEEIIEMVNASDTVLLDATFYSKGEIRRQQIVPHPEIKELIKTFRMPSNEFYLTHLNHSNPALDKGSEQYNEVVRNGLKIARERMKITI